MNLGDSERIASRRELALLLSADRCFRDVGGAIAKRSVGIAVLGRWESDRCFGDVWSAIA